MSNTLVLDCPICNSNHITFDVRGYSFIKSTNIWELLCVCRACKESSCVVAEPRTDVSNIIKEANITLKSSQSLPSTQEQFFSHILQNLNNDLNICFKKFTLKTFIPNPIFPPEYLPEELNKIFNEAAKCLSIGCYNAAGAMFRLCLDMTTKYILQKNKSLEPTNNDNKTIHNRLTWIFKNRIIADDLEELSRCIKDDGNDAAHDGTIGETEANDLLDFTYELLERVYTQPERVKLAKIRRAERRSS
ncbi:DUF4145 domain-containing protein [Acinetobacter baumannii]|uniref:DUF4145 domain-containing protein n=1 Tax=Acinetobacter baumannii TaxID=470 RepID=UPI00233E894C|nr:DUF4145 domain-containing protein [Acinetobacter baumannii]MDC5235852.1 DUF4145 domain-containing protein [Acinetobacter baumannii]MDC5401998.1 DUF4145 domain-containing protein [Acinetobacter baumannii]MDC5514422.1 DUF4145 domain-containing protein [Acinetobacter baumannii]MDK2107536.1 DUF4145 domain-containing protein [Acinetobacter baumannii]MDK2112871.1 DUF4145 domain-containing protein [Acinetobacter baumannii]